MFLFKVGLANLARKITQKSLSLASARIQASEGHGKAIGRPGTDGKHPGWRISRLRAIGTRGLVFVPHHPLKQQPAGSVTRRDGEHAYFPTVPDSLVPVWSPKIPDTRVHTQARVPRRKAGCPVYGKWQAIVGLCNFQKKPLLPLYAVISSNLNLITIKRMKFLNNMQGMKDSDGN